MRKIVHLSDVHFGTVDPDVAASVVRMVNELGPDVVVVSGDLTQRARRSEFLAARAFLDELPTPQIVVPGNHDIPAHNLVARFLSPLSRYRSYITDDLTPTYFDDELAIVGVNTARSNVIKGGRINQEQSAFVESQMRHISDDALRVVVTHHPFDLPANSHHREVVGRADRALPVIAGCGGNVLLSGHLHVSHIDTTAKRYQLAGGGNALVIQAGSATSSRGRGEPNSFNLIEFEDPYLRVERYENGHQSEPFVLADQISYKRVENGWVRAE